MIRNVWTGIKSYQIWVLLHYNGNINPSLVFYTLQNVRYCVIYLAYHSLIIGSPPGKEHAATKTQAHVHVQHIKNTHTHTHSHMIHTPVNKGRIRHFLQTRPQLFISHQNAVKTFSRALWWKQSCCHGLLCYICILFHCFI